MLRQFIRVRGDMRKNERKLVKPKTKSAFGRRIIFALWLTNNRSSEERKGTINTTQPKFVPKETPNNKLVTTSDFNRGLS